MKPFKLILIILAILAIAATAWFFVVKHRTSQQPQAAIGTLEFYDRFSVWLPDGYVLGDPCNILYMHDGQMLFDSTTTWNHQEWQVDEILGKLIADGTVPPTIVVAMDNSKRRLRDLLPGKISAYMKAENPSVKVNAGYALGDKYLKYLVEEVKPFIDSHYKPLTDREHTFIAGSSMGGLMSLYALCEYPSVFSGAACMSSHLSIGYLFRFTRDTDAAASAFRRYVSDNMPCKDSTRLYMDYGKAGYDAAYQPYQEAMDSLFVSRGWDSAHYKSLSFEGHDHNETCWANRLDVPLRFLLVDPHGHSSQ